MNPSDNSDQKETTTTATEPVATPVESGTKKPAWMYYAIAAIVLIILALGLLYVMEKQGKTDTGLFDSILTMQSQQVTVALVNGQSISQYELDTSIEQLSAGAASQGIDQNDPQVQQGLRDQALEVLINTELLRQEAERRGVTVTDEEVQARLDALVQQVGGEEVLAERMEEFGVSMETLESDIRSELAIQKVLDAVFAEREITVTEEEINEYYTAAGGEEAGLPPLQEVRDQVELEVQNTKQQEIINELITELRASATIEIIE